MKCEDHLFHQKIKSLKVKMNTNNVNYTRNFYLCTYLTFIANETNFSEDHNIEKKIIIV